MRLRRKRQASPPPEALAKLTDGVVRLRPYEDSDADALTRACLDPEVSRWTLVPSPYTKDDARKWIAFTHSEMSRGEAYHLLIADPQDDRLLGAVGLVIHSSNEGRYGHAGYWLAPEGRGHGYATRALHLVTAWGLDQLHLDWVQVVIDPRNEPSRQVALRAEYSLHSRGPTTFKGEVLQFDHYRAERPKQ